MSFGITNAKAKASFNGSAFYETTTDATLNNGVYELALSNLSDTPKVNDYVAYVESSEIQTLYKVSAVGSTNATLTKEGDMISVIPLRAEKPYLSPDGNKFTIIFQGKSGNANYTSSDVGYAQLTGANSFSGIDRYTYSNSGTILYDSNITWTSFADASGKTHWGMVSGASTLDNQNIALRIHQFSYYGTTGSYLYKYMKLKINFNVFYYDTINQQYVNDNNVELETTAYDAYNGTSPTRPYAIVGMNVNLKKGTILLGFSVNSIEFYRCNDTSYTKPSNYDATIEYPYS